MSRPSRERLRFLQVHLFYDHYLENFYQRHVALESAPFEDHIQGLVADGFSAIHMVAPYLDEDRFDSRLIIANDSRAQQRWLEENGLSHLDPMRQPAEVLKAQIDLFQPDVLYVTEPLRYDSRLIRSLARRPRLVLGWRAADIPPETDWSEFDVILSCLSGIRSAALGLGARAAEHFHPGFPTWIWDRVRATPKMHDLVFCGTWTLDQHAQRNHYLSEIAHAAGDPRRSFECHYFLSGQTDSLTPEVARHNQGSRYGMEMYREIHAGRIAFDARGQIGLGHRAGPDALGIDDLAENETANMRIFEVTGCGSLLLTESRDNLARFFEPGREIVTYRDSEELVEKIHYYLAHPREREQISERGRERCHRDHSMQACARALERIVDLHLERRDTLVLSSAGAEGVDEEPDTLASQVASALDLLNGGESERALVALEKLIHTSPEIFPIEYARAVALARLGRRREATRALDRLLAHAPAHPRARMLRDQLKEIENDQTTGSDTPHRDRAGAETHREFESWVPKTFTIETALACNLKCPECAIGADLIGRPKSLMRFEDFKRIADRIRPYAEYVYLHLWGEPLLNKRIYEMISYVAPFARTNISTNGLLIDESVAERLVTSGLSDLIVSIDGVSQQVYEKYRVGGKVARAFEALAQVQRANARHGNPVSISPQFIVFKHSEHERTAFADLCRSLGLAPSFKAPYIRNDDSTFELPSDPEFVRPSYPDVESQRAAMMECSNPREVFTIQSDGSVVVCCHDYDSKTHFGNIFEQDVLEIWNSPEYREFRWRIVSGDAPSFCVENCMTWTREKAKPDPLEINLCCGPVHLEGFVNIDLAPDADVVVDLERELLAFPDESADVVVCMSAINYFSLERAGEIVADVHRVLKPGGIARFGTQDLRVLAERYLAEDRGFWCEQLEGGGDRFPGRTLAEKFNGFFDGFETAGGKHCRFVHDYPSLALLFEDAGFSSIERRSYRESALDRVDEIDNRPEQMFYLEAHKAGLPPSTPAANRDEVLASSASEIGEDLSAAWQRDLQTLRHHPEDSDAFERLSQTLVRMQRWEPLAKLCERRLEVRRRDPRALSLLPRAERGLAAQRAGNDGTALAMRELQRLSRCREPRSDAEHLAGCIAWLLRAQRAWPGGGVAALYHPLEKRWDVDYPETTGYIIPTLLAYRDLTGDPSAAAAALRMAEWELEIQDPEGGAGEPIGAYAAHPRVFNTSQVILGWLAAHGETADDRFLVAAERAGSWILRSQLGDGSFVQNTYAGPRSYHARTAWALLELHAETGEPGFRSSAEANLEWVLGRANQDGWFSETSLGNPERPWTHLIAYTLVGLLKVCVRHPRSLDLGDTLKTLVRAGESIHTAHAQRETGVAAASYVGLPGTLDWRWQSDDSWSCLVGDAQMGFFLRLLGEAAGEPSFTRLSEELRTGLERVQLLEVEDADLRGGLFGSYPIEGGYCAYTLPNWGAKFLADLLMQPQLPAVSLGLLG